MVVVGVVVVLALLLLLMMLVMVEVSVCVNFHHLKLSYTLVFPTKELTRGMYRYKRQLEEAKKQEAKRYKVNRPKVLQQQKNFQIETLVHFFFFKSFSYIEK